MEKIEENRNFMKSKFHKLEDTDYKKGVGYPDEIKKYTGEIISLPSVNENTIKKDSIHNCIKDRKSNRVYIQNRKLLLEELSYLLWATQGVRKHIEGKTTFRTVPSAGSRHPYETYIMASNVEGLDKGVYRFLPEKHGLGVVQVDTNKELELVEASRGQTFLKDAAATFFWVCNPYRAEWRYGEEAHKMMLIDVGHICQNLYIGCEALELGTCGIAAYDQKLMDKLLGLDGINEYVVYLAPVGIKE